VDGLADHHAYSHAVADAHAFSDFELYADSVLHRVADAFGHAVADLFSHAHAHIFRDAHYHHYLYDLADIQHQPDILGVADDYPDIYLQPDHFSNLHRLSDHDHDADANLA